MSNRQRLARERLEVYLLYLLLAYRRWIWVVGLLLFAYGVITLLASPLIGFAALVPAAFLLLLGLSYPIALFTARLGAWIATLWRHDP